MEVRKGRGCQPIIHFANFPKTFTTESKLAKRCVCTSGRALSQIRYGQQARWLARRSLEDGPHISNLSHPKSMQLTSSPAASFSTCTAFLINTLPTSLPPSLCWILSSKNTRIEVCVKCWNYIFMHGLNPKWGINTMKDRKKRKKPNAKELSFGKMKVCRLYLKASSLRSVSW